MYVIVLSKKKGLYIFDPLFVAHTVAIKNTDVFLIFRLHMDA